MMENFALYLLKSVVWLTGFAAVYILFLRNERFFEINRLFLLTGVLVALIFPFITFRYSVILEAEPGSQLQAGVLKSVENGAEGISRPDFRSLFMALYLAGLLMVAFVIIKQGRSLARLIRKSRIHSSGRVRLIRTDEYDSSFSFFSYVFVNPSVTDAEMKEIMNHEMVHIRQKHWFDLLLVQLLCVLQWFNPVIWIYLRHVRQNHEYIADKLALQRTADPAFYRAALLNQIIGTPVISLVNSFNSSPSKNRFKMMENIFSPPLRKLRILVIIPVMAFVFYAFAKPEYKSGSTGNDIGKQAVAAEAQDNKVKGTVIQKDGTPLHGATIIVAGTTTGTISDQNGNFVLENISPDAALAVSYVGFKSKVIKSGFVSKAPITMERDTINYIPLRSDIPPPPPPPPPGKAGKGEKEIADPAKVMAESGMHEIPPPPPPPGEGEKVVPGSQNGEEKVFIVVEDLPQFPGGMSSLRAYIMDNLKYPAEARKKKVSGTVAVDFIVTSTGKISNVTVNNSQNPLLNAEAMRIISSMPEWKPGTQNGKPVDVQMRVPVEFKL